jgi:hypothetical protein
MSDNKEGSKVPLRIVITDIGTGDPNWDDERMRLVIEAARKVIEVMRGPYRHSPGKLTVHQVDTLSRLASLLGEAPIEVDAAAILAEHDRTSSPVDTRPTASGSDPRNHARAMSEYEEGAVDAGGQPMTLDEALRIVAEGRAFTKEHYPADAHSKKYVGGTPAPIYDAAVDQLIIHAERIAMLERVLLAARLDITYGTPTGTHTREMLANAVAAVDAASA